MRIGLGDGFELIGIESAEELLLAPPCARDDADHATCTWWEDADRGVKAGVAPPKSASSRATAPAGGKSALAAFLGVEEEGGPAFNPFAPKEPTREEALRDAAAAPGQPPKLRLLTRQLPVSGPMGWVLVAKGEPVAYCQAGPLSAFPRAQRLRDRYPDLPDSPPPAIVTCISVIPAARGAALGSALVEGVLTRLGAAGFSAAEAYPEEPEVTPEPDATSAATRAFWERLGFSVAATGPDGRWPVMRRTLS
ncbi:MAG: GNAT family N-acetyltransferase [Chloroflexi bacterium]|jgi:ribosomal protein S18 acetylase RimI-like enzyme|nr:MAG: GNAT family N-acetyltransferase [Chloroflexota bacterium]RLT29974.1 MAG: GNAT family N-acetyltransferase [Chloroflexota bacterium]